MALLHCTALTPFFLSLDRPTSSSDPTQLSHTHNTPLPPSARFPDPGYTSVTTFLSRPLPDLVLSLLSSLQNTREISTLTQPLGKFSISDHRISICLSLHPSLIPSIRGPTLGSRSEIDKFRSNPVHALVILKAAPPIYPSFILMYPEPALSLHTLFPLSSPSPPGADLTLYPPTEFIAASPGKQAPYICTYIPIL